MSNRQWLLQHDFWDKTGQILDNQEQQTHPKQEEGYIY